MRLSVRKRSLLVELEGKEKVLAVKRSLTIPLSTIASVSARLPRTSWRELRAPGTFLPGLIKAGTYYTPRGKEFWYVRRGNDAIVLELRDGGPYCRVVLTPPQAGKWAKRLCALLKSVTKRKG